MGAEVEVVRGSYTESTALVEDPPVARYVVRCTARLVDPEAVLRTLLERRFVELGWIRADGVPVGGTITMDDARGFLDLLAPASLR